MKNLNPFIPAIIWALLITGMDLVPANPIKTQEQKWIIGPDKFIHFAQHFVLSSLLFWGFLMKKYNKTQVLLLCILIPVALGTSIEIAQELWVPNRHFNIKDIFANVLGAIFLLFFTKTIATFQNKFFNQ